MEQQKSHKQQSKDAAKALRLHARALKLCGALLIYKTRKRRITDEHSSTCSSVRRTCFIARTRQGRITRLGMQTLLGLKHMQRKLKIY